MLSNANREINWLAPHPLALLLIFIQRAPSVYPVKRRRRGGGSGVGQAARSLDPFSIATAGSPGGTKSRVASSAPTKGAGSRHRSLSGDIPCPEQHPYLHCLLPPSSPPPLLLLPQPGSAPSRSWAWRRHPLLAPCSQRLPAPYSEWRRERRRRRRNGAAAALVPPRVRAVRGRARSPHARRALAACSPAPAWEHPDSAPPFGHRWPLGLKHLVRRAAEGEGMQVSAVSTCSFSSPPCI